MTDEELKNKIRAIVADNSNGIKFTELFCRLVEDACEAYRTCKDCGLMLPVTSEVERVIREMPELGILEYHYSGKWKGFVYFLPQVGDLE